MALRDELDRGEYEGSWLGLLYDVFRRQRGVITTNPAYTTASPVGRRSTAAARAPRAMIRAAEALAIAPKPLRPKNPPLPGTPQKSAHAPELSASMRRSLNAGQPLPGRRALISRAPYALAPALVARNSGPVNRYAAAGAAALAGGYAAPSLSRGNPLTRPASIRAA
jgi:hypothetical protein